MKLLANENFPKASVLLLRKLNYDVKSIGEDNPSVSDKSVMEIADREQRIILTFDRDYGELIYKHNLRPVKGVIFLRLYNYTPEEPAIHVHQLLKVLKISTDRALTVFNGTTVRQRKY
ncbi:MAG TPA: DUF5615 family PIN-like protein [Hanamia sp.]|nr:DUF5615 family PIN-like protein [Hanamia sp.]